MPRLKFLVVLLIVTTACTALGAGQPRSVLTGARTAVAERQWRATLDVRPAPRTVPRVSATLAGSSVRAAVRRLAAGRYAVTATFPRPGRWRIAVLVGSVRRQVATIAVAAAPVRLSSVLGIARHPDGGLLIADGDASRIVRLELATGRLTTFASAGLAAPTGIDVGPDGTVYVADRHVPAVFRVRNGNVARFAEYPEPLDVAVDAQGTVFVTGRANTVARVDPGTGASSQLAAQLDSPHGVAVDPDGNVVVAELAAVSRIDPTTGAIELLAGSGRRSLCGERGAPRVVCLTALRVAFAPSGNLWIADPENRRLWRVADGEARAFNLGLAPMDVAVESETRVLVADNQGRRVVRFDAATGSVTALTR